MELLDESDQVFELRKRQHALKASVQHLQWNVVQLRSDVREFLANLNEMDILDDSQSSGKPKELNNLETFMKMTEAIMGNVFEDRLQVIQSGGMRVGVDFRNSRVKFYIDRETTFEGLSIKAANYWGIQKKSIFFAPVGQNDVMTPSDTVAGHLFVWGPYLPTTYEPAFNLVLSGGRDAEEIFDDIEDFSRVDFSERKLLPAQRQEQDEKPSVGVIFRRRLRKNLCLNILQLALTLALFVFWAIILVVQQYPGETSWMADFLFSTIYEDRTLTRSKLYPEEVTATPMINSARDFWNYLGRQRSLLNFEEDSHTEKLAENIYVYEAIQLRQLRSEERTCDHSEYGKVPCPRSYSLDPSTEDVSDEEGFTYDSEGSVVLIPGIFDWYIGAGLKLDLLTTNATQWDTAVRNLIQNSWVASSTRVAFVTFNVINPSLAILNVFVFFVEISYREAYSTNFSSFSFNYSRLDAEFITLQTFTILISLSLLWVEARLMLMSKEEVAETDKFTLKEALSVSSRVSTATDSQCQAMLDRWAAHSRTGMCTRLKRGGPGDKINLISLTCGLILQMAYGTLLSRLKSNMDVKTGEHSDLYPDVYVIAIVTDLMLIILIGLSLRIPRQLLRWVDSLHKYYEAWTSAFQSAAAIAMLFYLLTFGYSAVSYYLFGPYYITSSEFASAYIHTMSLALGNFNYHRGLAEFSGRTSLTIYLLIVRATVYILILLVCSMFMGALLTLYAKSQPSKHHGLERRFKLKVYSKS